MDTKPKDEEIERTEFKLTTPINVFGEMVDVLKWRKPVGADFVHVGNPVVFMPFVRPVQITHDMPKMIIMLARLTNVPTSSIERMDPGDIITLSWDVTPFFMPRT